MYFWLAFNSVCIQVDLKPKFYHKSAEIIDMLTLQVLTGCLLGIVRGYGVNFRFKIENINTRLDCRQLDEVYETETFVYMYAF